MYFISWRSAPYSKPYNVELDEKDHGNILSIY